MKKEETVFVLGNGKSRLKYNLEELDGITAGCNAIYRDFKPDYLFAQDAGIIAEIMDSGYVGDCYFHRWSLLPAEAYEGIKYNLKGEEHETYRRFDDEHFAYISGLDNKCIDNKSYIIWIRKGMEERIKELPSKVEAWSTGTQAVYTMCRDLSPKRVVLLGFDHEKDEYENVYADTEHYFKKDNCEEGWYTAEYHKKEHDNWKGQLKICKQQFPEIKFVRYYGYTL